MSILEWPLALQCTTVCRWVRRNGLATTQAGVGRILGCGGCGPAGFVGPLGCVSGLYFDLPLPFFHTSKWTWNNYLSKHNPAQLDNIRLQLQRIMERNKIPLLSHFSDPKSCLLILLHALCCSTTPATHLVEPTMQNENNSSEIPRKGTTFGCETYFQSTISQ